MLCRKGQDGCLLGSRGELPTARALRALARVSEAEKAPLEFTTIWHVDPGNARSLRFRAKMRYSWAFFHRSWASLVARSAAGSSSSSSGSGNPGDGTSFVPLPVTPQTEVSRLALALVTEARKTGRVALQLNPSNDAVLNVAAKALATASALEEEDCLRAGTQAKAPLVCVLRWPKSRGAARIYAHIFRQSAASGARAPAERQVTAADTRGGEYET
eukprot:TRINITY_DN17109_c1_g1_i1.p2 TRINITY_DN17109_c1_g1~~TRINITY_DN17109_c1_g1_i1.p2  ORF type:complete len:216 (-),score=39.82 TRINITY_DN17109_c1_g1_i1:84-731(-)